MISSKLQLILDIGELQALDLCVCSDVMSVRMFPVHYLGNLSLSYAPDRLSRSKTNNPSIVWLNSEKRTNFTARKYRMTASTSPGPNDML